MTDGDQRTATDESQQSAVSSQQADGDGNGTSSPGAGTPPRLQDIRQALAAAQLPAPTRKLMEHHIALEERVDHIERRSINAQVKALEIEDRQGAVEHRLANLEAAPMRAAHISRVLQEQILELQTGYREQAERLTAVERGYRVQAEDYRKLAQAQMARIQSQDEMLRAMKSPSDTDTADPQIAQITQRVTNLEKLARGEAEEFKKHAERLALLESLTVTQAQVQTLGMVDLDLSQRMAALETEAEDYRKLAQAMTARIQSQDEMLGGTKSPSDTDTADPQIAQIAQNLSVLEGEWATLMSLDMDARIAALGIELCHFKEIVKDHLFREEKRVDLLDQRLVNVDTQLTTLTSQPAAPDGDGQQSAVSSQLEHHVALEERLTAVEGLVDNLRARHVQVNEAVGRLEGDGQQPEDGGQKSESDGQQTAVSRQQAETAGTCGPTYGEIADLLGRCRLAVDRPDGRASSLVVDIAHILKRIAGWRIRAVEHL